jgi:hypothetical protein
MDPKGQDGGRTLPSQSKRPVVVGQTTSLKRLAGRLCVAGMQATISQHYFYLHCDGDP